nr:MAG TPA: hypothetical protein [Caudoviricetes sp.]
MSNSLKFSTAYSQSYKMGGFLSFLYLLFP